MEREEAKSLGYASAAVLIWSTVATAFKLALREMSPEQVIFIASGVSLLFFMVYLAFIGQYKLLFQVTGKELRWSALTGALNPFAYYLILFKAYSLLPAQLAQPLNMIWPFTLALLSVPMLKQKITGKQFAALGVSFAGIVILTSQGSFDGFKSTSFPGIFLALGSSVFWALYWILNVKDHRPEAIKLFFSFLFGFLYLLLYLALWGKFKFPASLSLWASIYTGLFEAGITYLLWMKAMQLSRNNAVTGSLVYITPFISLLIISGVLGEKILGTTVAGLVLIVSGILVQQINR
mgnify:CR=1 FL=1